MSRQKELDPDPKAIQQIEFVGQLKKLHAKYNAKKIQVMINLCFLNNFTKNQRNEIKHFSRKCNSIMNNGRLSRNES